MKYQVHYPKIGKVTIKVDNVIMKYHHNDIVDEQAFFARYPHIFIARPDLRDGIEAKEPETKLVESEQEFKPVMPQKTSTPVESEEKLPVPVPVPETKMKDEALQETFDELNNVGAEELSEELDNAPEQSLAEEEEVSESEKNDTEYHVVETESKGWYVVVDDSGTQLFPEDGKKVRKKKAEEFIEENK